MTPAVWSALIGAAFIVLTVAVLTAWWLVSTRHDRRPVFRQSTGKHATGCTDCGAPRAGGQQVRTGPPPSMPVPPPPPAAVRPGPLPTQAHRFPAPPWQAAGRPAEPVQGMLPAPLPHSPDWADMTAPREAIKAVPQPREDCEPVPFELTVEPSKVLARARELLGVPNG